MNLMSILQEEEVLAKNTVEQKNNGVYKLPTLLTNVQRELQELLIESFRQDLLELFRKKQLQMKKKTSINSLLDDDPMPASNATGSAPGFGSSTGNTASGRAGGFTLVDRVNLLFEQLRLIDKHPTLLVDHFMPRKLLLLDISERMLNVLGKLQLFNKVVDSFIDNYPKRDAVDAEEFIQILVVALSVKEIELIEGLIIGKKIFYRNLSSDKLYEDNRSLPEWTRNVTDDSSSKLFEEDADSLDSEDGNGRRKRRKKAHRLQREAAGGVDGSSPVCLHLITSQQLYNLSLEIKINFIFSFDLNLDHNSPSVELIRNRGGSSSLLSGPIIKTPILMPVPGFSIEHCIMKNPFHGDFLASTPNTNNDKNNPYFNWKLKCIGILLTNRRQVHSSDDTDFYVRAYGNQMGKLESWFRNWSTENFPLAEFDELISDRRLATFYSEVELEALLQLNYFVCKKDSTPLMADSDHIDDYKNFKKIFAKLLIERVEFIDRAVDSMAHKSLLGYREREGEIQLEIDEANVKIGEEYRQLKKVNDEVTISERKVVRSDGDLHRYTAKETQAQEKIEFIKAAISKAEPDGTISPEMENELDSKINSQFATIDELRSKLAAVQTELAKLNLESEKVREMYQSSSGEAVSISSKVDSLKAVNTKLKEKVNGPGSAVLQDLLYKDELISYEFDLNKLKVQNELMDRLLAEKLHGVIKERQTIMESTGSGSSSRGARLNSRASTPF